MSKNPILTISIGLALVTLVVFWQVAGHEFINLDDNVYVTANPQVQRGLTIPGIAWAFSTTAECNWHPLTWMSHMLDYGLYGPNAMGHHVTSLLLHLANVLLLFQVLRLMTGSPWRSGVVAALFAVHPLHVESVAWVSERKDVLSTLFWLLTMWAYVRYCEFKVQGSRSKVGAYIWVIVFFALGLMAKPMLVTLPFVLLLLDYWPLNRVGAKHLQEGFSSPKTSPANALPLLEKIPLFVLSILSSIITFAAQRQGRAVGTLEELPIVYRIENAVVSYVKYVWMTVWPRGTAVFYPHPGDGLPIWQVIGAALLLIGITVLAIRAGRPRPYIAVGWLWYGITLMPVIGLVQVGRQAMADRYTYIPLVGLFIVLGWGIPDLVKGRKEERKKGRSSIPPFLHSSFLPITAAVALLALAICAFVQARYWENSVTLFSRAIAVTRDNAIAHTHLGVALMEQRRPDEAIRHYRAALRINPDYTQALVVLGAAMAQEGNLEEAEKLLTRAVTLDPRHPDGQNNLGAVREMQNRLDESFAHYQAAVRAKPDFAEAHLNLGAVFVKRRMFDDAEREFLEAARIKPDYADAHYDLGLVYNEQGRMDEAVAAFQEALRLQPDLGQAHAGLAATYYWQEKYPEAWEEVQEARKLGAEPPPGLVAALSRRMAQP